MKQVVLLRNDVRAGNPAHPFEVPAGKMVALFAHASCHSMYYQMKHNLNQANIENWMKMPHKIALAVPNDHTLLDIVKRFHSNGVFTLQICYFSKQGSSNIVFEKHEGLVRVSKYGLHGQSWDDTELGKFNGPIAVCIGPDDDNVIDRITGTLPLYRFL